MAIIDWPTAPALQPQGVEWRLHKSGVQFRSPFAGTVQSVGFADEHWTAGVSFNARQMASGGALESILMRLAGGVHRIRIFHFARPVPRGTLRGTPTLNGAVAQGATTLNINNVPAGQTVLAGDMLGVSGQLFMVYQDATADVGGNIVAVTVNRARVALSSAVAVVWSRPTVDMIMAEMSAGIVYRPRVAEGAQILLEEAP